MSLTETGDEVATQDAAEPAIKAGNLPADMRVLALDEIVASATNPRMFFNEPRLLELAESIRATGVHQPILVRPLPASRLAETFADRRKGAALPAYEIVAGERRYRASKLAEQSTIPAIVRPLSDDQVLEVQLIENLQRDDLNAFEEAQGYDKLRKATGISVDDLARKAGKSRGYIFGRLKLLEVCSEALQAFYDTKLDSSRLLVIARIPNHQLQLKALEKALATNWKGDPQLNFKEYAEWTREELMRPLGAAPFPTADPDLVPEAGSCRACPKRTGAQPDVFADVKGADVCTDTACFKAKVQAHEVIVIAAAKAKGQQVIPESQAKELWRWEHSEIDGYTRLDKPDSRVSNTKMLKTVLGKDIPEPILLQNPHKPGELVPVLPDAKVTQLLKDGGHITPAQARSASSGRTITKAEAERSATEKFERAWRKRAIEAVAEAMTDQVVTCEMHSDVCRLIAAELISGLRGDERSHAAALMGLGKVAAAEAIRDHIRDGTEVQAEQAMYHLLMQHDLINIYSYYSSDHGVQPAKRITAVAASYSVDLKPIQEAVAAELAEAAKPKASKKKAEPAPEPAPKPAKSPKAKKSSAPPAAQVARARKPSKAEVQLDLSEALTDLETLAPLKLLTPELRALLDGREIRSRDALADLSVDELVEITGQSPDDAKALIMEAREAWFDVQEKSQAPDGAGQESAALAALDVGAKVRVTTGDLEGAEAHVTGQVMGTDDWQVRVGKQGGKRTTFHTLPASSMEVIAAAPALPTFGKDHVVRVRADAALQGGTRKASAWRGRVGRVEQVSGHQVWVRFGPARNQLLELQAADLEAYKADPTVGSRVRVVVERGIDPARMGFEWRHGVVAGISSDGWLVDLDAVDNAEACRAEFDTANLEVVA